MVVVVAVRTVDNDRGWHIGAVLGSWFIRDGFMPAMQAAVASVSPAAGTADHVSGLRMSDLGDTTTNSGLQAAIDMKCREASAMASMTASSRRPFPSGVE
jgi:hypothetical protein